MNEYHFIYLLREKQDIEDKLNIFKIGKSTQENTRRVKSYPSGSYLYLHIRCNDCHSMETKLINKFKNYFLLVRGREYFKGDIHIMMDIIYSFIQTHVYETSYILENDDYKLTSGTLENDDNENKIIGTLEINELNVENNNISDILPSIKELLFLKKENEELLEKNKRLSQELLKNEGLYNETFATRVDLDEARSGKANHDKKQLSQELSQKYKGLSQELLNIKNQNKELYKELFKFENQIINLNKNIHDKSSIIHEWESRYFVTSQNSYYWENKYNLLEKSTEKENSYNILVKYLLNIKIYWIRFLLFSPVAFVLTRVVMRASVRLWY